MTMLPRAGSLGAPAGAAYADAAGKPATPSAPKRNTTLQDATAAEV